MRIQHPCDEQTRGLRALWKTVFGDPDEFLDLFFSAAFSPDRSLCAVEGETVAAALYWLDCFCRGKKLAYIYAVATDPAFRGRGLCRTLTEDAHRVLRERGYAGAILVPAEPGLFIMYGKLGYRTCCAVAEWEVPAGKPVPLSLLTKDEYAARRRALLPEGGVAQEGKTLDLLSGMGRFYAGDGVLLTAIRDGDSLWVPELLGNASKAPGIVAALGAKTGKFRGPGKDKAFAMYCPLDGSPAPTYLGFALD